MFHRFATYNAEHLVMILCVHTLLASLSNVMVVIFAWEKRCAQSKPSKQQTAQTSDSCFRLVGPHQHRICLAALL